MAINLLKVSPLSRKFNRHNFDCGSAALNTFLKTFAFQAQKQSKSRTYVLHSHETGRIIFGFYTLVVCAVLLNMLPQPYARRFRPNMFGVTLARLGVNREYQGKGYGCYLLFSALRKIIELSEMAGAAACFVDAKDGARDF